MSHPSKNTGTSSRGFDVGPGSWMDRFTKAHGPESTLLMWGRRPRTRSAARPDRHS
jgi:hypothetical protein